MIDKPLARRTRWHRDSTQINTMRNEKGDIRTVTVEIQKLIRSKTYTQQNWKMWMKWIISRHIPGANAKQNQINHLNSPRRLRK